MAPKQGDIVRYAYLDTNGEPIYGLVTEQDNTYSQLLILWGAGRVRSNTFRTEMLRTVD
jgi:hypothetical protein